MDDFKIERARQLRRDSTDAERLLWRRLRGRSLEGYKFVRQAPIASFVVDFVCRETKLVVEVDGGQHADNVRMDAARTARLTALGYRVVRFWNNDVTLNIDGVLQEILSALNHPSPQPSPREARGEGEESALAPRSGEREGPARFAREGEGSHHRIGRRCLIATGAAALATAPFAAQAQQQGKVFRIAVVNTGRPVEELAENGHPLYRTFFGELRRYSAHLEEVYGLAAGYVDRILKGANPGDLPVQLPTKFDFAINLKTARALGLTIPERLLVFATEVIE